MPARLLLAALLALGACADAPAEPATVSASSAAERLRASRLLPEIAAVIDLEPATRDDEDVTVRPTGSTLLGRDGAGGLYRILPDGRVLLIDSEGSFGVVGADVAQFIAVATGLPSWRDALRFVAEPDVERARVRWQAFVDANALEEEAADPWPYGDRGYSAPTPAIARERIRAEFGLAPLDDPFAALHQAVRTSGDVAVSWRGAPLTRFDARD